MILVNGFNLPDPDNNIGMTLEMITKNANRSENGKLSNATRVNVAQTFTWKWSKLSYTEMKNLCSAMKYTVPDITTISGVDYEEKFNPVGVEDFKVKITTILPCGIRTFYVYFGDQLKTTMCSKEIPESFNILTATDEQLEEYIYWKDTTVDVVGIGYDTNVDETIVDDTVITLDYNLQTSDNLHITFKTNEGNPVGVTLQDDTTLTNENAGNGIIILKNYMTFSNYSTSVNNEKTTITVAFSHDYFTSGIYTIIIQKGVYKRSDTGNLIGEYKANFTK